MIDRKLTSRGLLPTSRGLQPVRPNEAGRRCRCITAQRGPKPAALRSHRASLVLSIAFVLSIARVCPAADESRSGAEYVREGNKHLAAKRYREALIAYDLAREKLPDAAEVAYDRGVAFYRLGRLSEAETAFQDALKPDSPELEAKAKYNLGRCSHAAALAEQQDLPKAISELGRAIGFYKDALQLRPGDADAKQNSAVAERLREYLKMRLAQQKEQEKKEPSSQPGDEKQDGDESDGDEQQEGDDQQQSDKNEDGEEQNSGEQQPSSQPNEDESPSTQPSEKPPEETTTQASTQPSEEAATQPMTAASQPTSQPETPEEARRRMSIEQAMQMLQEARDAELQRREKRRAEKMRRRGRIPVDKDW